MSFFGVELNSQINRLFLEIRLKLAQNKLSPNFRTIYKSLAAHDPQVTGLISPVLFEKSLNENGLFFKKFQIQAFQKALLNQQGMINWFAFMQNLREPMGPYRRQAVQTVFDEIAKGKNEVSLNQLQQRFNPEGYDSFKKVTKDQKANFDNFVSLLHMKNGMLQRQQFTAYYDDISINFPHDDPFIRSLCTQWRCQIPKPETPTQQQLKQQIKALRYKLIQKTNGTKDEFLLMKLFSQFDINKSQQIGSYQLDLMLKKLQLPTQAKFIGPLLQILDKNKSGYIQYEEFRKFLFFDPFLS